MAIKKFFNSVFEILAFLSENFLSQFPGLHALIWKRLDKTSDFWMVTSVKAHFCAMILISVPQAQILKTDITYFQAFYVRKCKTAGFE